jgi:hypothetical protein
MLLTGDSLPQPAAGSELGIVKFDVHYDRTIDLGFIKSRVKFD